MPYSEATTEIGKAIFDYSETIDPPFHIFNDQKRVLFRHLKIGEEDNEDPLVGFIMYHKIGTPWPEGCFNFPTPPGVDISLKGFALTGFEIPSDAQADFDWKSVVEEAIDRLKTAVESARRKQPMPDFVSMDVLDALTTAQIAEEKVSRGEPVSAIECMCIDWKKEGRFMPTQSKEDIVYRPTFQEVKHD